MNSLTELFSQNIGDFIISGVRTYGGYIGEVDFYVLVESFETGDEIESITVTEDTLESVFWETVQKIAKNVQT